MKAPRNLLNTGIPYPKASTADTEDNSENTASCADDESIADKIKHTLNKYSIVAVYSKKPVCAFDMDFRISRKEFKYSIGVMDGDVVFQFLYPFKVQTGAIPVMTFYLSNYNSAMNHYGYLCLDPNDGELTMVFSYLVNAASGYEEDKFMSYLCDIKDEALRIYSKLAHLAAGQISKDDANLYQYIFCRSLEYIHCKTDSAIPMPSEGDISYGIHQVKFDVKNRRWTQRKEKIINAHISQNSKSKPAPEEGSNEQNTPVSKKETIEEYMKRLGLSQSEDHMASASSILHKFERRKPSDENNT